VLEGPWLRHFRALFWNRGDENTHQRIDIFPVCQPFFSGVSGNDNFISQKQDQSGKACLSYEPSVVELPGTIIRKSFADAQDRPETYWLVELVQPICVDKDPKDPDINYAQKNVREIQLVLVDRKMYVTYKDIVGKQVIRKGTLFAGITAHNHTSLLLTLRDLRTAQK
jgi:hypothetical protein